MIESNQLISISVSCSIPWLVCWETHALLGTVDKPRVFDAPSYC